MIDRPNADKVLADVRAQGGTGARGQLRLYLGMAPGVGKTVAMLEEGHRRRDSGQDVVVGYVETHGREGTAAAIGDLEVVPRARIAYKGVIVEEMDTDAILKRHPAVVLVDELAHTNAPGSAREKRWQDVEVLLDKGITVLSTVNIQHLESLAGVVETITGAPVRERLPDSVVDGAAEVELVDLSPDALRTRLRSGQVYPPERAERALDGFFKPGNLGTLRELALRKITSTVERNLEQYLRQNDVQSVWPSGERVMVCVDGQAASKQLIRRAFRMANGLQSDLIAVFVEPSKATSDADRDALEANLRYAEDLGATIRRVPGSDVAATLATLAAEENVGSIVIGHSRHSRLHALFHGSVVHKLLRLVRDTDIYVVGERERW